MLNVATTQPRLLNELFKCIFPTVFSITVHDVQTNTQVKFYICKYTYSVFIAYDAVYLAGRQTGFTKLTSGFSRNVDQICILLGHHAALSDSSVPTFRNNLSGSSSKVKKSNKKAPSWDSSPLKMGATGCPETSVHNYHLTLRNIPEELRSRRCRSCTYYKIKAEQTWFRLMFSFNSNRGWPETIPGTFFWRGYFRLINWRKWFLQRHWKCVIQWGVHLY
jgi:hypothetical protein